MRDANKAEEIPGRNVIIHTNASGYWRNGWNNWGGSVYITSRVTHKNIEIMYIFYE